VSAHADIGSLRRRLTVEEPVETIDALGGASVVHVVTGDTWAAVEPVRMAEAVDAAGRSGAVVTHRIVLRADLTVAPGWRLSGGGRRYRVLAVSDPDGRGAFLRCLAEEES